MPSAEEEIQVYVYSSAHGYTNRYQRCSHSSIMLVPVVE